MSYINKQLIEEPLQTFLEKSHPHKTRLSVHDVQFDTLKVMDCNPANRRKSLTMSLNSKDQHLRLTRNASNLERRITNAQELLHAKKRSDVEEELYRTANSPEKKMEKLPSINRFKSISLDIDRESACDTIKIKHKNINKAPILKALKKQQGEKLMAFQKEEEEDNIQDLRSEEAVPQSGEEEGKKYFYISNMTLQNHQNTIQRQKESNSMNKIMNKFREIDRRNRVVLQNLEKKFSISPCELMTKKVNYNEKKSIILEQKANQKPVLSIKKNQVPQRYSPKEENLLRGWQAAEDPGFGPGWLQ